MVAKFQPNRPGTTNLRSFYIMYLKYFLRQLVQQLANQQARKEIMANDPQAAAGVVEVTVG